MPHDEHEAVITLRDLHEDIKAIRNDLTTVITQNTAITATQADHESRIRSLERRVWIAAGVVGVIATALPKLAPLATALGG